MIYETQFLRSLLFTILVETTVVFLISKFIFKYDIKKQVNVIIVCALASALTLPYLWFIIPPYIAANYYLIFGELFVVILEIAVYKLFSKVNWFQATLFSIIANAFSFFLGLVIF